MRIDLVIDTNVLVHAHDTRQSCQKYCILFINFLLDSSTLLCVDEGFDFSESKNRSKIMSEYLNFVHHGTLGYALLSTLAQSQRVKIVTSRVHQRVSKEILKYVSDPTDRCFVKVAANSDDRLLISHDYTAMSKSSRKALKSAIAVDVIDAEQAQKLFSDYTQKNSMPAV